MSTCLRLPQKASRWYPGPAAQVASPGPACSVGGGSVTQVASAVRRCLQLPGHSFRWFCSRVPRGRHPPVNSSSCTGWQRLDFQEVLPVRYSGNGSHSGSDSCALSSMSGAQPRKQGGPCSWLFCLSPREMAALSVAVPVVLRVL